MLSDSNKRSLDSGAMSTISKGRLRVIRVLANRGGRQSQLCQDMSTGRILVVKTNTLKEQLSEAQIGFIYNAQFPVFVRPLRDVRIDVSNGKEMRVALPFFSNGSLADAIADSAIGKVNPLWTPTRKSMIACGIAIGLRYLHSKNIIFGWLKPTDVLLTHDFDIRITDFWNSMCMKASDSKSLGDSVCFIAPEVREGKLSRLSDVYSYGMILLSLITNKLKFSSDFVVSDLIPAYFPRHIHNLICRCTSHVLSERPSLSEFIDLFMKNTEIFPGTDQAQFEAYRGHLSAHIFPSFSPEVERVAIYPFIQDRDIADMCKREADKGNKYALLLTAIQRRDGKGCTVNKKAAAKLFQSAASMGVPEAELNHGILLGIKPKNAQAKAESASFIKSAADAGNSEAQFKYAVLVSDVSQNANVCREYLKKAILRDNLAATLMYADILMKGDDQDKKEAVKYIKKAADLGHTESQIAYTKILSEQQKLASLEGLHYLRVLLTSGNKAVFPELASLLSRTVIDRSILLEAATICKLASAAGISEAHDAYVNLVLDKTITVTNEEFVNCCRSAANQNNTNAISIYAEMLATGDMVTKDIFAAAGYYQKLADQGDSAAQYYYATFILEHSAELLPHMHTSIRDRALKYMRKSAEAGYGPAQYKCGMLLQGPAMTHKDAVFAFKCFDVGARQGDIEALRMKGSMLLQGLGCPMDAALGTYFIKEAADKGSVLAKDHYALIIRDRNPEEALKIFEANDMVCDSLYEAGFMYDAGIGTKPNPVKAFELFLKSADRGSIPGMFEVGRRYYYGCGVQKNVDASIEYLRRAADTGFPWAVVLIVTVLKSCNKERYGLLLSQYEELLPLPKERELLQLTDFPIDLSGPAMATEKYRSLMATLDYHRSNSLY